jgi:hypothetical protein
MQQPEHDSNGVEFEDPVRKKQATFPVSARQLSQTVLQ